MIIGRKGQRLTHWRNRLNEITEKDEGKRPEIDAQPEGERRCKSRGGSRTGEL
jgi:hypothetical protein